MDIWLVRQIGIGKGHRK